MTDAPALPEEEPTDQAMVPVSDRIPFSAYTSRSSCVTLDDGCDPTR